MKLNEQKTCRAMLDYHKNGFSLGLYLKKTYRIYVLLLIILAGGIFFAMQDYYLYRIFGLLVIGMQIGALARDFGWLRRIKMQWPLSEKITKWELVEQIGKGESNE